MSESRSEALDPKTANPPGAGAPTAAGVPVRRASAPEPSEPHLLDAELTPPKAAAPKAKDESSSALVDAARQAREEREREEARLELVRKAEAAAARREREAEAARREREAEYREREAEARRQAEEELAELTATRTAAPRLKAERVMGMGSRMEEVGEDERLIDVDPATMRETPLTTPKPRQARSTLMILMGKANETKANVDDSWNADPSMFRHGQYPTLLKPLLDLLANGKGTSFVRRSDEGMYAYQDYTAPQRFTLDLGKHHYPMAIIAKALPKEQPKPAAAAAGSPSIVEEVAQGPKKDAALSEYYLDAFRHFKDKDTLAQSPSCVVSIELDMSAAELQTALQSGQRFDQARIVAIHANKNAGWQVKGDGAGAAYTIPKESIFLTREQVKKDLEIYIKHIDEEVKKEDESNKKIREANQKGALAASKKDGAKKFEPKRENHLAQEKQLIARRMWRVLTDGSAFYQDTMAELNKILAQPISFEAQMSLPPEPKPSGSPLDLSPPKPPMTKGELLSMHRDGMLVRLLSWLGYGAAAVVTAGFGSYLMKGYARFWQSRGESLTLEVKDALVKDAPREDQPAVAAAAPVPVAAAESADKSWFSFGKKKR